jgi:hypothetical protein
LGGNGDGLRKAKAAQIGGDICREDTESPVCAIDMKPDIVLLAALGNGGERIDRPGADRAGGANDQEGAVTGTLVLLDGVPERRHVQALVVVDGNPADRIHPHAAQPDSFMNPGVSLR